MGVGGRRSLFQWEWVVGGVCSVRVGGGRSLFQWEWVVGGVCLVGVGGGRSLLGVREGLHHPPMVLQSLSVDHISADNQYTTEVAHSEGWKGGLQSQLPDEAHAVDSDIIVIRGWDLCDMTAGDLGGM